jgi:hypothetical protein
MNFFVYYQCQVETFFVMGVKKGESSQVACDYCTGANLP